MQHIKTVGLVCACALFVAGSPARAQDAAPAPAHIATVDGSATLDRDGQPDQAVVNMPFVAGDRLRTTSGRVEILFPDGTALDVDQFTEVELEGENAVRLAEGRAVVRVPRARYATSPYELTTPATSISASQPGDYRLAYPDAFESARVDDFERWISGQPAASVPAASASAQYLPADLQIYGSTLDQYGGWQYDQSYGYVWYPTVAPTWRPYYDGYWSPIRPYGWTWIGVNAWSWPTHHYGRWGWHHNRWFWIPARSWAPAWVAWGAASGYVSWCPLGWDSRPVFALSLNYGDPWRGWTVLPRGVFGYSRVYVSRHVVPPQRLHLASTPFVVQSRPPVALPRTIVSNAAAGSRPARPIAVPRAEGGPRYGVASPRAAVPAAPTRTPGVAVARGTASPSITPPPAAPSTVDRRPTYTPPAPAGGIIAGPTYRMPAGEARPRTPAAPGQAAPPAQVYRAPAMERRPMTTPAQVAPPTPAPRVAPVAPPAGAQSQPAAGGVQRQAPIARPQAQPAPGRQPAPSARPQAQPRNEGGAARPQAQSRGGERRPR